MLKPLHKEGGSAIDGRRELIDVHKGRVIHGGDVLTKLFVNQSFN